MSSVRKRTVISCHELNIYIHRSHRTLRQIYLRVFRGFSENEQSEKKINNPTDFSRTIVVRGGDGGGGGRGCERPADDALRSIIETWIGIVIPRV